MLIQSQSLFTLVSRTRLVGRATGKGWVLFSREYAGIPAYSTQGCDFSPEGGREIAQGVSPGEADRIEPRNGAEEYWQERSYAPFRGWDLRDLLSHGSRHGL